MLLVELPLKRLFAFTELKLKLLLVSRWPLATIPWLPNPSLLPDPERKSALTPGARMANWVKLPVPSGTSCASCESREYPFEVSVSLSSGVAVTDTLEDTAPGDNFESTVVVRPP